jgi:hypothetical protein
LNKINYDSHGEVKWKFHLVCGNCGRVFDKEKAEFIVEQRSNICFCGVLFAPTDKNRNKEEKEFYARPICPQCYQKKIKEKK